MCLLRCRIFSIVLVNILHSNADFLFSSQTAFENVGLNELSFTDVAENFVSETPFNVNPCGMHDLNMKDIKVDENDSIFILHLNISSLHKHFDELYELCVSLRDKPDIFITETRLAEVPLINISIFQDTIFFIVILQL